MYHFRAEVSYCYMVLYSSYVNCEVQVIKQEQQELELAREAEHEILEEIKEEDAAHDNELRDTRPSLEPAAYRPALTDD